MSENYLITVITVSYQAEKTIEETMKSVLQQTYPNIEYIIKDGESTDRTNEIVNSYKSKFEKKGILFRHIIGKDDSVYDAMNQAMAYCIGEWLIFMNADDIFYSENSISNVFNEIGQLIHNTQIIYGNTDFQDGKYHYLWEGDLKFIKNQCPFCHQSVFVRTSWMKAHPFDISLKITADYNFFLEAFYENANFKKSNEIIAVFHRGGLSCRDLVLDRKERRRIKIRYGIIRRNCKYQFIKDVLAVGKAYCVQILFFLLSDKAAVELRRFSKKRRMVILK